MRASLKSIDVVNTENGSPSFAVILASTSGSGFSLLKKSDIFFDFLDGPSNNIEIRYYINIDRNWDKKGCCKYCPSVT
jgi:hypothetical protein